MEYKDIFSPKTLEKLNKKSAENLKTMLGDKNLMQTMMSSQQILSQIARAEAPYKSELEQLAVQMVKELYPIVDEEGIVLDAKLVGMSDVGRELDEITVNKPNHYFTISMIPLDPEDEDDEEYISYPTGEIIFPSYLKGLEFSQIGDSFYQTHFNDITKHQDLYSDLINYLDSKNIPYKELTAGNFRHINIDSKYFKQPSKLNEALTPESRRRIINAITQGAALRGAFAFYLFKEHLDELDPSLVEKYNQIMKNSFGIYDDENAIAMMLAALSQGQKMAGGSSKVIIKEADSGITIRARAICFPMLVHELIKGLYELASLQGFKGDKAANQAVVDKVDLLKNEPSDIRYGKFIFDALNNIFSFSEYSDDPRVREFFFTEVYKLEDNEFIEFIENAINEELTSSQQKWVKDTLRDIAIDLKSDDFSATGLDEIKVNNPNTKVNPDRLPVFDLTIGNFDISKGRVGTEIHINSKLIHPSTRKRVLQVFDKLGIKPEKAWIAWMKYPDGSIASLKSTFILSHYNGEPILIAQTQTGHPQAGQIYIYSKYVKSGKTLRLPQPGVNKDDSNLFADRNATKEQILNALQIPDGEPVPLNEYSDKVINATLERWKDEKGFDQNSAKQLIQRFDQIKSSLAQRLDIVVLPDELKKSNKFLDINQYSFEDMVKLIASIPENPEKAKKEAIKKFTEKEGIDRNTAQSYVARFMTKRDDLKFAGKEGSDISKEDLDQFVPKRLMINNAYLDPRNWTWEPFEQMMDALFPSAGKSVEGEENTVFTDADKVYDKNGIEIYKGDDVHKCISYNPVEADQRKKYGWCVTQVGNTNYDYYRFGEKSPTFYFVFDRSKPSSGPRGNFDDQWHAFVVQVNADGRSYTVTGADNRGDTKANSWEDIAKIVPSGTWNKIKDLKDYFKPIALSGVERGRKFASGKNLTLDEFKELTQDEKILYIQGKASKNQISSDILAILPKYKINLEGRSTTLANVAIDSGQKIPYSSLKDNEQLAKRYAIFRFRHTNYSKDPIPLPYVKYLDEEAKKKYAQTFDEYLTYEYLDKFFGEKVTEEYVNKQVKNLSFLPKEADKYIKDPKLKQLFDTYSKLFDSWEYDAKTNVSDEQLENFSDMPEQQIDPRPMIYSQWAGLSNSERKTIIALAERYDQNQDYAILLWGLPFIIKDGSKTYALLPLDKDKSTLYYKWVLSDENGKIVKNLSGKSTLNGNSIEGGYADVESSYQRVYGMNDLKIDSSEVKENISKDLTKFFTLKKSW